MTGDVNEQPDMYLPLPIPPTLAPTRSEGTTDFYNITQKPGMHVAHAHGPSTPIEGFEGIWPGPTLRVRRGRAAVVTQTNDLLHPVTTHNHGHKVEAASDGHPADLIQPGATRDYHYPNDQNAGTYWLHDHTMNATSHNVWSGLASFYIIDDDIWDSKHLPSGDFDIPLLLQDRSFNVDGTLRFPDPPFGDEMMVNGVRTPRMQVGARKYMFRLLNGSDHRILRLSFRVLTPELGKDSDFETFSIVASDGGLLPHPVVRQDLQLVPAERYTVVFDFSKYPVGTSILIRNSEAVPPAAGFPPQLPDVMRFDVTAPATDDSDVPQDLLPITRYDPASAVLTRQILLGRQDMLDARTSAWYINEKLFDPSRIDFQAKLNTTEIWEIHNPTGVTHSLHLHLVQFQVLDVDDAPPPDEYMGWKDTVVVRPQSKVRIIVKWEGFAGVYVFHCHMIGHEDTAMMAQVQVSE